MTRTLVLVGAVLALGASTALAATSLPSFLTGLSPDAQTTVIVHVNGRANLTSISGQPDQVITALQDHAARTQEELQSFLKTNEVADYTPLWAANAIIVKASRKQIEAIAALNSVDSIEEDRIIPLPETTLVERNADIAEGQMAWGVKTVKADQVWSSFGVDGTGVKVGMIDTGIDPNHVDLKGKVLGFKDFVDADNTTPKDGQGHGTHCAGTILGGSEEGRDIGVAPGAKMYVARVFSARGASTANLLKAMEWMMDPDGNAKTNDAPRVISNSWGSNSGTDKSFYEIIDSWRAANIFPSFAAGNAGPRAGTVGIPGGYLNTFSVGATDRGDKIASFSSRGPVKWDGKEYKKPEVSAPGHGVISAKDGGGYRSLSGTSMACPHVTGIITLLYAANPNLSIDEVWALLQDTSTDLGEPGHDNSYGRGLANALSAVGMTRASRLNGKVKGADGEPLAASIAYSGPGGTGTVQAGSDGKFSLAVAEGEYELTFSHWGYRSVTATVTVGDSSEPVVQVMPSLPRGTVKGRVVNSEGQPVQANITVLNTPLEGLGSDAGTGEYTLSLPGGSYTLKVHARGYKVGRFEVDVVAGSNRDMDLSMDAAQPWLLVDDDGGSNLEDYYTPLLSEGLFHHHDVRRDGAIESVEDLAPFIGVIWFTGERSIALTSVQQTVLTRYLAQGGRLFLTGQNIARGIKNTAFLKTVLQSSLVADSMSIRSGVRGIDGDPISAGIEEFGLNGPVPQQSADALGAVAGTAKPFLQYRTLWGKRYAGVRVETSKYRTVFLGFGLEGVNGNDTRAALAKKILEWLRPSADEVRARYEALSDGERSGYAAQAARLFGVQSDSPDREALKFLFDSSREVRRTLLHRD